MQVRTEVEIAVPPAFVWHILTETRRYAEWNPLIPLLAGDLREGARLELLMTSPSGAEFEFEPRVIQITPEQELRWRSHWLVGFLFTGEHFFQLHALADGRTRFIHGEDFDGLLLRFFTRRITDLTRGFVYMNQALKRHAESEFKTAPRSSRT